MQAEKEESDRVKSSGCRLNAYDDTGKSGTLHLC